jgi:hypothetical protein
MKRAGPHFHIVGLMNDTAVISPEVMECEDHVLKIHGRSNLNGANNRTEIPSDKMKGQANKNAFLLSSNVPSAINRLRMISPTVVAQRGHSRCRMQVIMGIRDA